MSDKNKQEYTRLLALVTEAVQRDKALRQQYEVGNKFKFIHDRLLSLAAHIETNLASAKEEVEEEVAVVTAEERIVYIYLFNAQGLSLKTWQKMLTPQIYYDHSINRPIYKDKSEIEAYIRSKANKLQHAYIALAVKSVDIVDEKTRKDSLGGVLIRVRDGALEARRFISFIHNGQEYGLKTGELVKK